MKPRQNSRGAQRRFALGPVQILVLGLIFAGVAGAVATSVQEEPAASAPAVADAASLVAASAPASAAAGTATPDSYYGLWTLAPALAAIILAVVLRQVVPAMLIGILVAAFMMQPFKAGIAWNTPDGLFWYVVNSVKLGVEHYILGAFTDPDHGPNRLMVVLFTLAIGGMIGVMQASGGTRAVVNHMARFASNSRGGQLTAWLAGLVIFFDDYANCLIIGPTMRPVFDRLRISRQKLAYIIDATASCVASIMISTWLATEISMIDLGLHNAAEKGTLPDFLRGATGFSIFWASIPYRYYALLAIIMVFLVAITRRDFGPMLKAERAAYLNPTPPDFDRDAGAHDRGRAWYAIVPVLVIVGGLIGLLLATGWDAGGAKYNKLIASGDYTPTNSFTGGVRWMIEILGSGDTYRSVLYAGIAALFVGIVINLTSGAAGVKATFDGMMSGMTHVFPALCVLSLAWALSSATGDNELRLGRVAEQYIQQSLPARWLPLCTFLAAALVSTATGTSWGTINILCPFAVSIAAAVTATMAPGAENEARSIFLATVGAVLAGAVFGDHCSPLNDSTVMAALVTECSLESHVWTQMPYAVVTMLTTVFVGDVLLRQYNQPWWVCLIGGTAILWLILMIFGRRADSIPRGQLAAVRASE